MKNSIIIAIILLALILQVTGCKKQELTKKDDAASEKVKTAQHF